MLQFRKNYDETPPPCLHDRLRVTASWKEPLPSVTVSSAGRSSAQSHGAGVLWTKRTTVQKKQPSPMRSSRSLLSGLLTTAVASSSLSRPVPAGFVVSVAPVAPVAPVAFAVASGAVIALAGSTADGAGGGTASGGSRTEPQKGPRRAFSKE